MGIKIKLVKSHSGASERQVATIRGLGLEKFGSERILKDTPQVRGMLNKVKHLVTFVDVKEEPKPSIRRKPRKIRVRDAARAKATSAAAAK
jgi:large subunit ribosomal protein L30